HLRNLGSQMALDADNIEIRKIPGMPIEFPRFGQADTKFVLLHTGRNIRMCARINIRVGPNGNGRQLSGIRSDFVNQFQLWTGLDVEEKNALVQRITNFVWRFSNTREYDLSCRSTCPQYAKQFTTGNDVEARPPLGKPAQDVDIRVRLDGVTDYM